MAASVQRTALVTILDDQKLVLAFLDWIIAEKIGTVRGAGGWSGQGGYQGTFDARNYARIEQWFIDNEGKPG